MVVTYERQHCSYCGMVQKIAPETDGIYRCYSCGADISIKVEKVNKYIIEE